MNDPRESASLHGFPRENPFSGYLSCVVLIGEAYSEAFALLKALHRRLSVYIALSLFVISCAWIINILGHKDLLLFIIPILLLANTFLMFRVRVAVPILLGALLYQVTTKDQTLIKHLNRAFEFFLLMICSLVYSVTWPLIALTWISFENHPGGFWTIYLGLILIVMSGEVFRGNADASGGLLHRFTNAVRNAIFIATPRKLLIQFLITSLKALSIVQG